MLPFYKNIISEHEGNFNHEDLKRVARDISVFYKASWKSIPLTPLDYDNPAYYCAHTYLFSSINTALTAKYFLKLWRKKETKAIMNRKMNFKICCLGGGSGAEIVGICKALSFSPSMNKRLAEVAVLDQHHGWEKYFDSVMWNLISERDEYVPQTFFKKKFYSQFVQVDFEDGLSENAKKVVSESDVVCMVKFVSKFSTDKAKHILQDLEKSLKNDAIVLYIDQPETGSFFPVDCLSQSPNLKVVLGPLENEKYNRKLLLGTIEQGTYGCNPLSFDKVSVIGWIKTAKESMVDASAIPLSISYSSLPDIGSESEVADFNESDLDEESSPVLCDKYTQTDVDEALQKDIELMELFKGIHGLLYVLEDLYLKRKRKG